MELCCYATQLCFVVVYIKSSAFVQYSILIFMIYLHVFSFNHLVMLMSFFLSQLAQALIDKQRLEKSSQYTARLHYPAVIAVDPPKVIS